VAITIDLEWGLKLFFKVYFKGKYRLIEKKRERVRDTKRRRDKAR
jgi:hypothetical protein